MIFQSPDVYKFSLNSKSGITAQSYHLTSVDLHLFREKSMNSRNLHAVQLDVASAK